MLRNYKRSNLMPDLIAGSTAGAMMIPQGMAFGALSTLPPIVGLYISLFAPLTYFFLGTCHQISMGNLMMADVLDLYDANIKSVNSVLYSVMNSTISNTTDIDNGIISDIQTKRIDVACSVTFIVGMITILLSKLGLGFVTCFMSNSLITSFTVGVSIHVFTSQLKNGLGLKLERETGLFKLPKTWYNVCAHLTEANIATLITWILCIIIIYLVKAQINDRFKNKMKIPIPIELIMVIFGTLASYYIGLNEQYDVKIVKSIPKGIPVPKVPSLTLATDYLGDGILIAVVSYAQTVALAKTFGLMHKYEINPDQEMFACGAANVVCSLFSGYITAASVSRSVVVNGAGAKTQFQSLVACSIVLLVIVVLAPYFFHLPLCVLAAIICVNLRGMFWKLTQLNPLRRQSKTDFTVWLVTFLVAVFVDVIPGLLAGIAVSFLLIIIITQQ
ncbi:hypothetical protein LOTGIDRAFT_145007 [Lottia gigantea]|uniref:SLC26A/SulP transporter domain-containing protein n=1 Tax=Lottia gigantea TaxID=225164 RepID=V4ALZ2_LOTGI|nr:hypothetical protein LOTGIDRAFT_145007 [Lottia gigantea]ESO94616.1 hypothetical protein LOTGIDRAFT_145007 [Lottia gigantea]